MTTRQITYLEAVREAMSMEMRENEDVFILGEDIGVYGGAFGVTRGMIEEFGPERVRNTPISEAAIAGAAIGSALTGMRPILELQFSDFITIAMDQMVNQAAKTRYMFGGKGRCQWSYGHRPAQEQELLLSILKVLKHGWHIFQD